MANQQPYLDDRLYSLPGIWERYRLRISGTLGLLGIEQVLAVAEPFMLGVAINDLLNGSYRGILWLAGLEGARLLIGVIRRLYDTRVYAWIYSELANSTTGHSSNTTISKTSAWVRLIQELVDFFEWEIPSLAAAIISLIGALLMLLFLSPVVGMLSLVVAGLIALVFQISRKRTFNLNYLLNNELERQVTTIERNNCQASKRHFRRLARWRIHLSDLEAMNFGIAELLLAGLIIGAIVLTVDHSIAVGTVFSIIAYLIDFAEGLVILPTTYQQWIRAQEIGTRFNQAQLNDQSGSSPHGVASTV